MKKHSISIILALVICFSSLFVSAQAALAMGDIDGNGKIQANDARIVLRTCVELEKLNEQQKKVADVNFDGTISAKDARSILRTSVNLEKLHAHSYTSALTKEATCTENGVRTYTCTANDGHNCNDSYTEAIPATGHFYETAEVLRSATCAENGEQKISCKCGAFITQAIPATIHIFNMTISKQPTAGEYGNAAFSCSLCSHKENMVLCGHAVTSISVDKTTACSVSGCKGQVPSFNHIVNSLKSSRFNKFNGFTKSTTVIQKATATPKNGWYWALAQTLEGLVNLDIKESTEVKYSEDLTIARPFLKTSFPVAGQPFISNLTESDIKSITITKMNGVDFIKNLPSSYKVNSSKTVDLSKIKNSQIGNVYKVSVVLPTETISKENLAESSSPIEKIYASNYNTGIRKSINELYTELNSFSSELDFLSIDVAAITNCTVDYYFTTDTFAPVCAAYSIDMTLDGDMYVYINDDGEKQKDPTVTISFKEPSSQQSYYFFNNHFTVK